MIPKSKERKRTAQRRKTDSDIQPQPLLIPAVLNELMVRRTLICRICKRQMTKKAVVFSRESFYCVGCFAKTGPTHEYQVIDHSKLTKKRDGWTILEQLQFIQQAERYLTSDDRCGIDDQTTLGRTMTNHKTDEQVLNYISKHLCEQSNTVKIKYKEMDSSKTKMLQLDSISTTKTIKEDYKGGLDLTQVQNALSTTQYDLNRMLISWLHPKSNKEYVDYHLQQEMLEKFERESIYHRIETMLRGYRQGEQQPSNVVEFESICSKQPSIKQDYIQQKDDIYELELLKRSDSFITRWQQSTKDVQLQQTKKLVKSKPISKQIHFLPMKPIKCIKTHQTATGKKPHIVIK